MIRHDEYKGICKLAAVVYCEILSRHSPREAEENNAKLQSDRRHVPPYLNATLSSYYLMTHYHLKTSRSFLFLNS
jgi:hypothetical protein